MVLAFQFFFGFRKGRGGKMGKRGKIASIPQSFYENVFLDFIFWKNFGVWTSFFPFSPFFPLFRF
jgi:hypothetical protein